MTDQIQIKLDDDALAKAVSAQILTELSEASREQILKQAITYLVTPSKDRGYTYGQKPESPLQSAFDLAVGRITQQLAHEYVAENPEFVAAIKAKINEAAAAALTADERLQEAITSALLTALYKPDE